ncbi:MAG: hypothetical protein HRT57_03410 [Crocinitomicaceae bacterium]|nr:hypothetical protein [Crocinitomicaceae bacterium]
MTKEPFITDKIVKANTTLSWIEPGIVHIEWRKEIDIEIADIDDLTESFNELTQGEMVKVVSEISRFVNITPEARSYAAKQSPKLIGLAYVINGLGQRLILKFYIRLRRNQNPTKVFLSKTEAVEWLREL